MPSVPNSGNEKRLTGSQGAKHNREASRRVGDAGRDCIDQSQGVDEEENSEWVKRSRDNGGSRKGEGGQSNVGDEV